MSMDAALGAGLADLNLGSGSTLTGTAASIDFLTNMLAGVFVTASVFRLNMLKKLAFVAGALAEGTVVSKRSRSRRSDGNEGKPR